MSTDLVRPAHDVMSPPTPPFATSARQISRPLSEISDNSDRRRSTARSLKGDKGEKSRPTSEVREVEAVKRMSAPLPLQTITVNLVDYAAVATKGQANGMPTLSPAPLPPSPTSKPPEMTRPEGPSSSASRPVSTGSIKEEVEPEVEVANEMATREDEAGSSNGVSSLFMAKRASLRPSPLGATYADVAKPMPSPTLSTTSQSSFDSSPSSTDLPSKPSTKSKPSWLRRASGTAALRSKSKSPAPKEEGALPTSTSLPPVLPPRKGSMMGSLAGPSSEQVQTRSMLPPEVPSKTSYATVTAAGPSRSRLGEGQGRPAFSPSTSGPPLPSPENVGNIRGRLAAWTAAAQSTSSFTRSDSSTSLASTSNPSTSTFSQVQQRMPSAAQKVLGHAGSAVQKGWAGLRSRGVGGSISGMSSFNPSGRRGSMEPSGSWRSGLAQGGARDRSQSANYDLRPSASDGPIFQDGVVLRVGGDRTGRVFGRDLVEAGRTWGVSQPTPGGEGASDWDRRRRQCLPAVVVRAVDYLEVWGPKEEGIFRISGRSSHIARLRKEFDAGADLKLQQCHPGDLDPHAVSSIFKSYLRELPSPLLTTSLAPDFDAYVKGRRKGSSGDEKENGDGSSKDGEKSQDLLALLNQLPSAHWFLLADLVKLLHLIPHHHQVNRMTFNAVMLSLGPSLNISGPVLTELLDKQASLFTTPPPLTGTESANSLVDFGNTSITPPQLPIVLEQEQTAPTTPLPEDSAPVTPSKAGRSPRLPNKPSITRLFSGGSGMSKKSSVETMRSVVDLTPPRVELPTSEPTRLPSFGAKGGEPADQVVEELKESNEGPKTSSRDAFEAAVFGDHSRPMSTPIADMYQGTGSFFPPPHNQKSSTGLAGSSISASVPSVMSESQIPRLAEAHTTATTSSTNPATVIRRGPPVFFQSSGTTERHGRTPSGGPVGTKRKEDSPPLSSASSGTEGFDPSRVKRLSAGPGSMCVRDVVRTMEMTA